MDQSREQGIRVKDMWLHVGWNGKSTSEGPIVYGLGVDLISVAELKIALEADPQGHGDTVEMQKTTMKVMVLGIIPEAAGNDVDQFSGMRKIRFPWKTIDEGSNLQTWVFNRGSGALTTGGTVNFEFVLNSEWLHD